MSYKHAPGSLVAPDLSDRARRVNSCNFASYPRLKPGPLLVPNNGIVLAKTISNEKQNTSAFAAGRFSLDLECIALLALRGQREPGVRKRFRSASSPATTTSTRFERRQANYLGF